MEKIQPFTIRKINKTKNIIRDRGKSKTFRKTIIAFKKKKNIYAQDHLLIYR